MSKGLFFADEIFLRCLVDIKGLFETASGKGGHGDVDSGIVLTRVGECDSENLFVDTIVMIIMPVRNMPFINLF